MNRTLLWCTLLFVAFVIVFPTIQLVLEPRPIDDAVRDYFRLGIDLQGGTRLVYAVDYQNTTVSADQIKDVLKKRIDPTGTRNYIIQPRMGGRRLELLMAGADAREVNTVKSLVTRNGYLTFRICADPADVPNYERIAEDRLKGVEPPPDYAWIPLQWNSKANWDRVEEFLFSRGTAVSREEALKGHAGFEVIYVIHETAGAGYVQAGTKVIGAETESPESPEADTPEAAPDAAAPPEGRAGAREVADVEILVLDNVPIVDGNDFAETRKDQGQRGDPIILFSMKKDADAQNRLFEITSKNPKKRMGIALDGKMQSAPTIQSDLREGGQITGYRAAEERDKVLAVLQSGTLDVQLQLLWEGTVGPELGQDNINRGLMASLVALICVIVFMAVYYLFAGLIADLAMLLNLLVIILIMYWMQGTWTLPGIAGLILTVGMSVDANVLIFERIREEMDRGSSIRLAVRNGYARAMPAIIDGNLTTFFTAVILAWVGSPEVQGFAIVLIIGLATSMFTALLFTRSIFDLLIQAGLLRRLTMLRFIRSPNIRFSRIIRVAFLLSVILVIGGIALSIGVGDEKFAMEFRGGTQVEFNLKDALPIDEVRRRVAELDQGALLGIELPEAVEIDAVRDKVVQEGPAYADAIVTPGGAPDNQGLYRRVSVQVFSVPGDEAGRALGARLGAVGEVSVRKVADLGLGYARALVQPVSYAGETVTGRRYIVQVLSPDDQLVKGSLMAAFKDDIQTGGELDVKVESIVMSIDDVLAMQGAAAAETPGDTDAEKSDEPSDDEEPKEDGKPDDEFGRVIVRPILKDYAKYLGAYRAAVTLVGGSAQPAGLADRIDKYLVVQEPEKAGMAREIVPEQADPKHPGRFTSFVTYVYDQRIKQETENDARVRRLQTSWDAALRRAIADPPPLSSSKVDKRIGDEAWQQALIAIVLSLVIIVLYVWFRFARISYGLAAVIALVHDVSIALGLVILFSWIGRSVPFIGEMKIDLPMIGAFLTLIGYSLNDTIVVFDRIRENRGKFGELSESVINGSINQTLSRTVLTSFTTWVVVVLLYFFGGVQSTIHGFAFVLAAGVVIGTYSSICIASPLLLWFRKRRRGPQGAVLTK